MILLFSMTTKEKVEATLDGIRPALAMHGGNVELIDVCMPDGIVKIRFMGGCKGCPMSQITLKMGIETELLSKIPEIHEVQDVADEAPAKKSCCDDASDSEDAWFKELLGEEVKGA